MLNDLGREQYPSTNEKYESAIRAAEQLTDDLGKLDTEEVGEKEALLIAGQYLGRKIEIAYLEGFADDEVDIPGFPKEDRETNTLPKVFAGKYQNILTEAKEGKMDQLKYLLLQDGMAMSMHPGSDERSQNSQRAGKVLSKTGSILKPIDGNPITIPNPAWMEKPLPIKTQLQMIKSGGDID